MMEARNSMVGRPDSRRMRPTSCRLAKWAESVLSPPRGAEVDDAADAGGPCGLCEVLGCPAILLGKSARGPHRVDEVEGRGHARQGRTEAIGVRQVRRDHLVAAVGAALQVLRPSGQAAHLVALLQKCGEQTPADVAGRPGKKNWIRRDRWVGGSRLGRS